MQSNKYTNSLNPAPKYAKHLHVSNLLGRRLDMAHEIIMPSIVVTTCIALVALLTSPALTVVETLMLAISLSFSITFLSFQISRVADHEEDEAVNKDADTVVRAAFSVLAKDSGATSASFFQGGEWCGGTSNTLTGVSESGEDGSTTEEGGLVRWIDLGPDGQELES